MKAGVQEWVTVQTFQKQSWTWFVYWSQKKKRSMHQLLPVEPVQLGEAILQKKSLISDIVQKRQVTTSTSGSTLYFLFSDFHRQKKFIYALKTFLSWPILSWQFSKVGEFRTQIGSIYFPSIFTHMCTFLTDFTVTYHRIDERLNFLH